MVYCTIFLLFVYYGCLCFGGGSALVPIYIEDLINSRHWMTLEEFGNLIAISQMTPGPIGVNAATFFGYQYGGIFGGFLATCGLLLVPFFLMILVVRSLDRWSQTRLVNGIMDGLRPAVFGMIVASLVIYLGLSVFTEPIPWDKILRWKPELPPSFSINPAALILFIISTILFARTRIAIITVIFLSALAGAFFCR